MKTLTFFLSLMAFGFSAGAAVTMGYKLRAQDRHIEAARIEQIKRLQAYEYRIDAQDDAIWMWLQEAQEVACRRGV